MGVPTIRVESLAASMGEDSPQVLTIGEYDSVYLVLDRLEYQIEVDGDTLRLRERTTCPQLWVRMPAGNVLEVVPEGG